MPGTRSWLTSLGCQPRAKESFTLVASSTGLPWSWLLRQGKKTLTYRRSTLIGLNCSTPITPSFSSSETAPREPCCWWELWTTRRESPYTMNCSTLLSRYPSFLIFGVSFLFTSPSQRLHTGFWVETLSFTVARNHIRLRLAVRLWHRVVSHWLTLTPTPPYSTESHTHSITNMAYRTKILYETLLKLTDTPKTLTLRDYLPFFPPPSQHTRTQTHALSQYKDSIIKSTQYKMTNTNMLDKHK